MTKAEQVIELICETGTSMKKACDQIGITPWSFLRAIEKEQLAQHYARAIEFRADMIFEETIEISDEEIGQAIDEAGNIRLDSGWQQHKRQRIDTRKWALARMNPKKYGDKIETVITQGKQLPDWME